MRLRFFLSQLVAIFIILGTILPLQANAYSEGDVSISMNPENPTPSENTTVTLSSYVYDLNGVLISWSVNGKNSSSGIGKKSFSVNAPSLGGQTTVTATLGLPDGNASISTIIKPSVMIMLWQATNSYVPPFYKGKALPSPSSQIKIIAMPEIKSGSSFLSPKNMLYSWQLDSTNDQENSGYGKNIYLYSSDYLEGSNSVNVTASTVDQRYSTNGTLSTTATAPKIEFYKKDSALGTIWDQALSDGHKLMGDEILQAAPYFISPKDIRIPFLNFTWSINNEQISVPSYSKNLMPITAQAGTSGTAKIGLQIDNTTSLVDTVSKEINVQF